MQFMQTSGLTQGDGHSVVIFPGLGTDRHATPPLRRFCKELGYRAIGWDRGINRGLDGMCCDGSSNWRTMSIA